MDDVFFKKLKQVSISADAEKTQERLKEIWENADKENRKELVKNAGPSIYNAIGKISKSGRITAKMTIMLSRYLDVNPFYLIGSADEKAPYSEILLKEFLIKFGYKTLWKEYEKFLIKFDMKNISEDVDENEEETAADISGPVLTEEAEEAEFYVKDDETEFPGMPEDITAPDTCAAAAPGEAVKSLADEDVLVLMRALLIRAKVNADAAKIAGRIKALLLLN